jgi:pyruvate dehydrogenase E1 component
MILENDQDGVLLARFESFVDGDFQEYANLDGTGRRKKLIGNDETSPKIEALLAGIPDEHFVKLRRGGHDAKKMYAAYDRAIKMSRPTVILAKTIKGWGMGKAAEGKNKAHQTKDLSDDSRVETKNRYGIPITDEEAKEAKFWFPGPDAPETKYLLERRNALGGFLPERSEEYVKFEMPSLQLFEKQLGGSEANAGKSISTTGALVDIMGALIRNPEVGKYVVPIVPDEAQTFGMEPLFNSAQIWNQQGQKYTALEIGISVIKYKESKTGQVFQEGINEDGAMASFTAAGTAYALHGLPMIPFYIYYSMFGFQRVGDVVWAAADMMCKGFLLGGTAGRTTLNGEGLQHQDGHSLLLAQTMPSVISYDPAFAYELAVIVNDGIRRMYINGENKIYYLTLYNENLIMPAMPAGVEEGIKRGIYRFKTSDKKATKGVKAHLFGSGVIMKQVLEAAEILENEGISTDIWSVTSWTELYRDANACDRWNLLHPGEKEKVPYIQQTLQGEEGVFVSSNDWMKMTAGVLQKWMPHPFHALGTDGFGLSESRESLRDYFEISARYTAFTAVRLLQREGKVTDKAVSAFIKKYGIEQDKMDPMSV